MARILVGCEESQAVTIELRKLGHEAYSCDTVSSSGGYPEWHLQMDVFQAIDLMNWDAGIFFPPCTYLTISANKWYKDQPKRKSGKLVGAERRQAREEAIDFFLKLYNCKIKKVAIENPIGVMSTRFRKPDQVIQPFMFGHLEQKATCLWLRGLHTLVETDNVEEEMKKLTKKERERIHYMSPSIGRSMERSKTFPGIAKAMAKQWFGNHGDE